MPEIASSDSAAFSGFAAAGSGCGFAGFFAAAGLRTAPFLSLGLAAFTSGTRRPRFALVVFFAAARAVELRVEWVAKVVLGEEV